MRFVAPSRECINPAVFQRQPLSAWEEYAPLLNGQIWPAITELNRLRINTSTPYFIAQTPTLLADGHHYESRIAKLGQIATRTDNWHDLLNALVWLRYPEIKQALNTRQMAEIAHMGIKVRSRAQYALTHFDEAGIIVLVADSKLVELWDAGIIVLVADSKLVELCDAHDWHGLFWRMRASWGNTITAMVFGHAILEHALVLDQLLVGKAFVLLAPASDIVAITAAESDCLAGIKKRVAQLIMTSAGLLDPQELRPLPLSGVPGWTLGNCTEHFYYTAPCFQPLRKGRIYPSPIKCL